MDCRRCNWYLCTKCHPQERDPRHWLWGSVSLLALKASEELQDLKEVADNLETMGPLAACTAPPVDRRGDDEIRLDEPPDHAAAPTSPPCTPVGNAPVATPEPSTPPKTAPQEQTIDLLGLDIDKVEVQEKTNPQQVDLLMMGF